MGIRLDILRMLRALTVIPRCVACGSVTDGHNAGLCEDCRRRYFTEKAKCCTVCGFPAIECRCGIESDGKRLPVIHCALYDPRKLGVVARLVFSAKDGYYRDLFEFMANECYRALIAKECFVTETPLVTWVPRRMRAYIRIGHDQSRELAVRIAKKLGTDCVSTLYNGGRSQQKALSRDERMRNARMAYRLKRNAAEIVCGKTVIIVDDLITTGATLTAASALLKKAGAKRLVLLTYAKTDNQFRRYRFKQS